MGDSVITRDVPAAKTPAQTAAPAADDRTQTELPRSGSDDDGLRSGHTPAYPENGHGNGGVGATDDASRYEHVEEHARGGLGRIVRARDVQLGRTVAIKELLKSSAFSEALFMREALITARLQHPGIVPVHEAGRWPSGEPYYVMKLVSGQTLKQLIEERDVLGERLALLPKLIAVAETIAYAHSERVIHRDIKPANLVVGEYGETVVVDWGLARDRKLEGERDPGSFGRTAADLDAAVDSYFSVSGKVVGTPAYMAPEQARGGEVDERCDVYALGAVLYELLTGAAPYPGKNPQSVVERVLAGPPAPVEEREPDAPADLVAIARKAMSRDRVDRYPSAVELAEDLKRFQTGQLVSAHNYSTAALVRRWLMRHRSLVSAAIAGIVVMIVVGVLAIHKVLDQRNRAETAHQLAREQNDRLLMLHTRSALADDPTAALAWLKRMGIDERTFSFARDVADDAIAHGVALHALDHGDWILGMAFSPDGRTLATACRDGTLRLWDVASGRGRVLGRMSAPFTALAYSPDGTVIAGGGRTGELTLWDPRTGASAAFPRYHDRIHVLRFTADGRRLSVRSETNHKMLDIATRELVAAPAPDVTEMAYADDGTAAFAYEDGRIVVQTPGRAGAAGTRREISPPSRLWHIELTPDGATLIGKDMTGVAHAIEVATGAHRPPRLPLAECMSWFISPDSRRVLTACKGGDLAVWELATGDVMLLRGHVEDPIWDIAFTADGLTAITGADDETARVWNLATGTSRVLRGHTDDVLRVAISPDGAYAATGAIDGAVRIWRLDAHDYRPIGNPDGATAAMYQAGPDGIVTISKTGALRLWDTAAWTSQPVAELPPLQGWWSELAVAAGGSRLARTGDGVVDSWSIPGGEHRAFSLPIMPGSQIALTPDGSEFAVATGRAVEVWDIERGVRVAAIEGPTYGLRYAPDGSELAITRQKEVELWNRRAGRVVAVVPARSLVDNSGSQRHAQYSDDGQWLAAPGAGGIALWNRTTGATRALPVGLNRIYAMSFSPDGAWLAATLDDRRVMVWSIAGGAAEDGAPREVSKHQDAATVVTFSRDGRFVISGSFDQTIHVFELATGSRRVLYTNAGVLNRLLFSARGELLSMVHHGGLQLWDVERDPTPDAEALRRRVEAATTATIGERGRPWSASAARSPTDPVIIADGVE